MGQALYRKYRSRSLDEIVGQPHVVALLRQSIDAQTLGHAYLLTGIRGVGKTSIARILAHEINGLSYDETTTHLDIIEIDAASNSSVEDIRDLREKAMIAPVSAPKKIYIIDEVHMLSKSAFNALLKTLEEPPAHIVFILATTDVHKLPSTILSRVQRFNLRPISVEDITGHLKTIAAKENIAIDDDALRLLAIHGNGSFRDAISLLDQARNSTTGVVTAAAIESALGLIETDTIHTLIDQHLAGQADTIIQTVRTTEHAGIPATAVIDQLLIEGKQRAYENPALLPLLDKLVDAKKSQWPDIKLLAALVGDTIPAPPQTTKPPAAVQNIEAKKPSSPPPQKSQQPSQPAKKTKSAAPQTSVEFNWDQFISTVREQSIGAFSVLTRCSYAYDGSTLHVYCGKAFAKKQLEKQLPALAASLQALGLESTVVELLAEQKPSSDETVAAALAIMGGGEEVNVNG